MDTHGGGVDWLRRSSLRSCVIRDAIPSIDGQGAGRQTCVPQTRVPEFQRLETNVPDHGKKLALARVRRVGQVNSIVIGTVRVLTAEGARAVSVRSIVWRIQGRNIGGCGHQAEWSDGDVGGN